MKQIAYLKQLLHSHSFAILAKQRNKMFLEYVRNYRKLVKTSTEELHKKPTIKKLKESWKTLQ